MPLHAHYCPDGIFYNGSETNPDGSVTLTREYLIPFQRNRFCNPLGRLLGPGGRTVKWIRRESGCDIIIHTNDVRFLKIPSKVTIKGKGSGPNEALEKVTKAERLVLPIIDPKNPNNVHMSDFQLFRRAAAESEDVPWVPEAFNVLNSAPNSTVLPNVTGASGSGRSMVAAAAPPIFRPEAFGPGHFAASRPFLASRAWGVGAPSVAPPFFGKQAFGPGTSASALPYFGPRAFCLRTSPVGFYPAQVAPTIWPEPVCVCSCLVCTKFGGM